MFERVEFKTRAKEVLRSNYWTCFLATLLISLIGVIGDNVTNKVELRIDNVTNVNVDGVTEAMQYGANLLLFALPMVIIGIIVAILINLFVVNMLRIGQSKFFIEAREGNYNIESLLYAFKNGNLKNQVVVMFMHDLIIALWTLLFVIPGIIAGYRYHFVTYILADNPDMNYHDALALSAEMTNGIKMDLFILDLSFIGWHLLDLITFGVASFFIAPYEQATQAEVYAAYATVRSESYETF